MPGPLEAKGQQSRNEHRDAEHPQGERFASAPEVPNTSEDPKVTKFPVTWAVKRPLSARKRWYRRSRPRGLEHPKGTIAFVSPWRGGGLKAEQPRRCGDRDRGDRNWQSIASLLTAVRPPAASFEPGMLEPADGGYYYRQRTVIDVTGLADALAA